LGDFRGQIVVLDFFAFWCGPCLRATTELESGIQQFYAQHNGNAHGVPVRVVAVNTDDSRPEKTDAFIKKTGVELVLNDADGAVFQRYGGRGLPYVVVINATDTGSNAIPQVVYRHAGFEGLAKLREVINAIAAPSLPVAKVAVAGPGPAPVEQKPVAKPALVKQSRPEPDLRAPVELVPPVVAKPPVAVPVPAVVPAERLTTRELHSDFAALCSSDVLLTDTVIEYRQTRSAQWAMSLSHGYIGLHYKPQYTTVEQKTDVEENRFGAQVRGRFPVNERLALTVGGGGYDGYTDYRSLWLNEHYRQLFGPVAGYEKAEPWGLNVFSGLRWEYRPATGFLQTDISYQYDVVAPGYEKKIGVPLIRMRDQYDTVSGRLTLENVLTKRLRALQEFQITSTTDRELRYALQSSLNCALGEQWVLRLVAAGALEEPGFNAWSVSATLERDWNETWFVSVFGRYYKDTGQLLEGQPGSAASPPVATMMTGVGLRWQGKRASVKIVAGPYFNWYSAGPTVTDFTNLYRDRDWFSVQFAFAYTL
jgi:thiol-disulfide isomerase/thioredoxin